MSYIPIINPVYVVLGMLDESMGRLNINNESIIERFYPAEEKISEKFVLYLEKIANQKRTTEEIKVTKGPGGHLEISSLSLANYIKDFYNRNYISSFYDGAIFTNHSGESFSTKTYGISEAMFPAFSSKYPLVSYEKERKPVDCRFSYLVGAGLRYGKGNSFTLSNASHKVELIILFLETLGARRISKTWTVRGVPQMTEISFEPNEDLASLLAFET